MTVGLGGHAKLGCWAPVRVVVNNPGEATRGELVIPPQDATGATADYRTPVEVPASSRRAFVMYARPRVAAAGLQVEFRPAAGAGVAKTATCTWHDPGSRIVLGISRKSGGLGTIGTAPVTGGNQGDAEYSMADSVVAYASPDRSTGALGLPDRAAGYEGITAVVLRDISPRDFEDYERDALVDWVQSGGLLIITSAPNVAELRDSFIEKLSPVNIRGQRVVPHLGALAEYFRQNVKYGRALVAAAERKRGTRVIVEQDGLPLLACRPSETGMVYFLGADCTAPPLDAADALQVEMWSDILADQHPTASWPTLARLGGRADLDVGGGLSAGIVQLPILQWEAFGLLGGYLLAYIAVLVAVNLLAKRLDRREWTGQATLAVIVVFSLGALYIGSSTRLASCRTYEAGVAALRSGASVAWLEAVSGLRSPSARAYSASPAAEEQTVEYALGARRERSWPVLQQATFGLRGMPVDLWGFGALRVQGPWRMDGRITTRLVAIDAYRVAVSIENQTPYDLRWPFVLLPSAPVTMPGLIPAGSTRETDAFERSRFQRQPAAGGKTPFDLLVEHCKADDSKTAPSPQARIRHRLLQQLGKTPEVGRPRGSWLVPAPYPAQPPSPAPDSLAPTQPLFGAWVEPPGSLVSVSPAPGAQAREVLVLVEVSPESSASPPGISGVLRFSELLAAPDATARGVQLEADGKLTVDSGPHEVRFRLSTSPRPQRLNALALTVGADTPGLQAEVYDYRNRQWRPADVQPRARAVTVLEPPADYIRWPWVKVRLTHSGREPGTVYCTLAGEFGE